MSKQKLTDLHNNSPLSAPVAILDGPDLASKPTKSARPAANKRNARSIPSPNKSNRFPAIHHEDDAGNRQAELFYLQKQIQMQTQMIFILEDGSRIEGVVEWYDRHSIKVRGKLRLLIYKSAIKYLYKAGELGGAAEK